MATVVNTIVQIGDFDVAMWLHTAQAPTPEEWKACCDSIAQLKRGKGFGMLRSFVVSDGGGPDALQRKQLFIEVYERKKIKVGVITRSFANPMTRGMAKAISWINPGLRFAGPAQSMDVFRHVDLDAHVPLVWKHMQELQKRIKPIETFAEVERVLNLK
jgi:hypothetical protein